MFDNRSDPRFTSPTTLYRYHDVCGQLLYVGITSQPWERHAAHFAHRWISHAKFYRAELFPTRKLAEWAEMQIIDSELPTFNTKRMPPWKFASVSDDWFVDATEGKPVGCEAKLFYLDWPDGHTRYVQLVECDAHEFEPA